MLLQRRSDSFNNAERIHFGMLYRHLQIHVILANKCLQDFMWPNIEYNGSFVIISLLYAIIILKPRLNFHLLLILIFLLIVATLFCFLLLDYGSRPLRVSRGILQHSKEWRGHRWSSKFYKSCTPIALLIGPFHKVDRKRAPNLIRFCLQRTFFLVLQTIALHAIE